MKKNLLSIKRSLALFLCATVPLVGIYAQNYQPDWAKKLIIYEMATRGFTSPAGPQSGTFKSAQEKLPYLQKMGINGIWLTGTNLADSSHFYNIWTQYACIDPGKFDPVLGTPQEFKAFVDAAHVFGIRVFLDVITHGVMSYSPLIKEHPDWFRGGSWGMTDFDWHGNKTDLDDWWVKIFTDYVTEYEIDGYRLDVDIIRPDLWNRIKKNAADAGHPIVLFPETWNLSDGASDFLQRMVTLTNQRTGPDMNVILHKNVAQFFDDFNSSFCIVEACVTYTDGSSDCGYLNTEPYLDAALYAFVNPQGKLKLTLLNHPVQATSDKQTPQRLRIEGIEADKVIEKITVRPFGWHTRYNFGKQGEHLIGFTGSTVYDVELTPFAADKLLYSIQLSSHDDGWEGFPLDKNPYAAGGSRSMFGYSCLLAPAIPIFMSGEEFNADYIPFPSHTPGLFGEGEQGKGRWLYASMIDWEQLREKSKQQMLEDVTRMITIRNADFDLFTPVTIDEKPRIKAVTWQNDLSGFIPAPYMLYGDTKAIIVCGNPTDKAIKGILNVSFAGTPLENAKSFLLTDLWNEKKPVRINSSDLKRLTVNMKPDKTSRGGLAVLKIEIVE